jgi:hypothetical protein
LKALCCGPIEGMAAIATDPSTDINLRFQAFKELAQYVYPKKKAVEVAGEDGHLSLEVSATATFATSTTRSGRTGAIVTTVAVAACVDNKS